MGGRIENSPMIFVSGFGCDDLWSFTYGIHDHTMCDAGLADIGADQFRGQSVYSYHGGSPGYDCPMCDALVELEDVVQEEYSR